LFYVRPAALVFVVGIAACGGAGRSHQTFPDAPMQLADASDREQAIDQLWVLPPGPERDAIRAQVATALAWRITRAVEEHNPYEAAELLYALCALWRTDPERVGQGLAAQLPLVTKLRAMFAKSGSIEPTLATLVLLAEIDPAHRTEHLAELDEVLGFADELATAENGEDAERGQPIAMLQTSVLALPLPWLVDRYVTLLEERQRVVARLIAAQQLPMRLINAHHDVIHTAHRIANVLARAGRLGDIHTHLAGLSGIGTDRELDIRAEILADQPTPDAYSELARALRTDKEAPDPAASLAVCLHGLQQFPDDAGLYADAAGDAATLGRVAQPIALYEGAVQHSHGELDNALALRLGKLYAQRIASLAVGGRPRAATLAWHDLAKLTDRENRRVPGDVWRQVAALGEASLGRGLASQGQLADAERTLRASLGRAPSVEAYETLVTIYLKTGRIDSAARTAIEGLELLGSDSAGDRYHRAKLERLAADAARATHHARDAASLDLDSIRLWTSLGKNDQLPRNITAERELELARAFHDIGDADKAVDLDLDAIDNDPSPQVARTAVAFLFEIDRPADADEAVHRALGAPELPELDKVYLCLWSLGDARHRGDSPDRAAVAYLTGREGDLWYEQLAEAATGRRDFASLRAAATTAPRQAELAFYGTVLGLDPAAATPAGAREKLEEVVRAGLVLEAEYDLARRYLGQ
jgi:tetratricopeptide (TPR) repeat protein